MRASCSSEFARSYGRWPQGARNHASFHLDAIFVSSGSGQRLVATESIPEGWLPPKGCKVMRFTEKRNLLREAEFKEGADAMGAFVKAMRDALAGSDQTAGADESEPVGPAGAEDDDEE